jgi:hypothetical protein
MGAKDRFTELCEQAAKQLGVTPDNDQARLVATLRGTLEQIQIKLVAGHTVDPALVVRLTELIQAQVPAVVKPAPKVQIAFVEGVVGIFKCQHCGRENHIKDRSAPKSFEEFVPPKPTAAPVLIDSKASAAAPATEKAAPAHATATATNTEPTKSVPPLQPPKHNPRWSDGPADTQFALATDFTAGVPGYVKQTAWSGSQALFGPTGGAVKGNGKLPGDTDSRP